MKKIILFITGLYMLTMSSANSADLAAGGAMGIVSGLMPILQPLAKKTLEASLDHFKDVITGATCPILCRGPTGVPCMSEKFRSSCKQTCQKVVPTAGYDIKIRFGPDWDLVKCVKKGISTGQSNRLGKGNPHSIAIYTQEALDDLLRLLAMKKEAMYVVDTKGVSIEDVKTIPEQELEKYKHRDESIKEVRERAVKEAKEIIINIDAAIRKNILEGNYGDQ